MSEWAMRRFWQDASVEKTDEGFDIRLDGRQVRTPGKRRLTVPTRTMAERIADEWRAQEKTVDPATMPWTRSANSALDKVSLQRDEVRDHLVGYAGTDLLCYRAEGPEILIDRQADAWDPLLDWLRARFGVALAVTRGVMPVTQPASALPRLRAVMDPMTDFHVTGFHDLVTLSGSYVIALAAIDGLHPPEQLWDVSRLDEIWQAEQWGKDEEATDVAETKRQAFLHAWQFYSAA